MNDARRKEIQRAVTLIEQSKDILEVAQTQAQDDFDNMSEDLQDGDEGLRAEEAVDALERAVTCCNDAISACADALQS